MTAQTINNGESGASVRGKLNDNFTDLDAFLAQVAWWTGKTEITILGVGDSNSVASGGVDPGVIPDDATIRLWVNPTAATPYSTIDHDWGYYHPDAALRAAEYASAITVGYTTYTGQLFGGNGNPAWALANRMSASTDVLKYVFQTGKGGTRLDFWASGDGWDSLEAEVPVALAAIPGSPTAFDIILMSFGGNDMIQSRTAEQIADDFDTFRTNAKAAGWWGPNTQVIIMECPDNGSVTGYIDGAMCYEYILNRSDERVGFVPSVGLEYDPLFPVHFLPASYVKLGVAAADLALSGLVRHKGAVRDNTYLQKLAPVLGGDMDADGFDITGASTVEATKFNGNHYGGLTSSGNSTAEAAITATAARVIQGWTADDPSNLIVPAHASGTLTVPTGGDGTYRVSVHVGFLGSATKQYVFSLFKNTGPTAFAASGVLTGNVFGIGVSSPVSFGGTVELVATDTVSLYAQSADGGIDLIMAFGNLFMERIDA